MERYAPCAPSVVVEARGGRGAARRLEARWTSALLALTTVLLVAPLATAASPAPAEILIAVDTSESMQFAVGAQVAPDCTDAEPKRSRWNAVLEMLLGSHSNYGCMVESLAAHPDVSKPPKQQFGTKTCIGGVPHVLADDHKLLASTSELEPVGDRSWAGAAPSAGFEMSLVTDDGDMRLPYLVLDTKSVVATDDWVSGRVEFVTKNAVGAGVLDRWVYLVEVPLAPSQASAKDWVCAANGSKRSVVSEPAKLNTSIGGKTVLSLTSAFAKAMQTNHAAGKTRVVLALVPVDNWMADDCSGRAGKIGTKFSIVLHGAFASSNLRPASYVGTGKVCAREGPDAHFAPKGARSDDGVLDVFKSIAKYGLLVPDNTMAADADANGGFSFAGLLSSLWGDINVGIADPFAVGSPSVAIVRSDLVAVRDANLQKVKDALGALRPSGGTPLGRMLEDIGEYFGPGKWRDAHFQTSKEDPVNGDPYYECRQRVLLLFTDGGSNLDDGVTDGRVNAIAAAATLLSRGITVYVVAVGHDGLGDPNAPSADDLDLLDQIALAGGSTAAWRVQTPNDLAKHLKVVLGEPEITGTVGTRSVWTEDTGHDTDVQHTFYAKSYFDSTEPVGSRGIIEQRLMSCLKSCVDPAHPGAARVCSVLNYEQRLKDRSEPRKLYSMVGGNRLVFSTSTIGIDALAIPDYGQAPRLKPDPSGACVTEPNTFDLSDDTQREQYRKELIALTRSEAGTCREERPLGAVGEAQPAVLGPAASLPLSDAVFKQYAASKTPTSAGFTEANPTGAFQRPTMLFAATHDGWLHAFRSDRAPTAQVSNTIATGDEMWAFMPGFSLRRQRELKVVSSAESSLLGGDVVAAHVLLERKVSAVKEAALQWRAVVVVGAGEAGAGYMALDVTAPEDPVLLWEITPERHCWGPGVTVNGSSGPKCALVNTFAGLGRSTAKAVLARAFYAVNGVKAERAVAILAAGKPPADSSVTNTGVDGTGERAIFVVELATGRLVRKLGNADISLSGVTTPVLFKDDLGTYWTEPACYNTAPGALVTRCFIGDSKGMMWRVDLSQSDPADWKIEFFDDAYSGSDTPTLWVRPIESGDRVPFLSPPSIAANRSGELVLVYGTGSPTEAPSIARRHLVYSQTETFAVSSTGSASAAVAKRNWVKALDESSQFVGAPLIFSGDAYWSTYTSSLTGLCATGTARIWGAAFDRPKSASDPTTLQGAFPNPAAPSITSKNLDSHALGSFVPSPVEINPAPVCVDGCGPTDTNCLVAKGGALRGAPPSYQVSVASTTQSQSSGQKPGSGTQPEVGTAARTLAPPGSTSVITGWDLLYD